jgi:phosphopantothenoylcysteine decarboxylase/phosphopantothenate--cysteine ligase
LLGATLLATKAPVLLCAAMHSEMWAQPSVQENLATLRRRGVMVLEPETGQLAGGDVGVGRMAEPAAIFALIERIVRGYRGPLSGRRVLISAGGTREAIDPVRVIANRSSGRQGYALAEVAHRFGAAVTLVSTVRRELALDVASAIEVIHVESAAQMREVMLDRFAKNDCAIMAAAVADFTVAPAKEKIKKDAGLPTLTFEINPDVVVDLVAQRSASQVVVAFAAETTNVTENARAKLARKDVDLLVVNDVSVPGAGFEHATNEVVLLSRDGVTESVSLRSKEAVAMAILARVASLLSQGAP